MNKKMQKRMEDLAETHAVESRGYDFYVHINNDKIPIAKQIRSDYEYGFKSSSEIYEPIIEELKEALESIANEPNFNDCNLDDLKETINFDTDLAKQALKEYEQWRDEK